MTLLLEVATSSNWGGLWRQYPVVILVVEELVVVVAGNRFNPEKLETAISKKRIVQILLRFFSTQVGVAETRARVGHFELCRIPVEPP